MSRPFSQLPFGAVPDEPRLPHPFFEAESLRVTVPSRHFGDVRVRAVRWGRGPAVACVHGFMTSSYSFRYLMPALGATHTVWAFDLVGAGESDKPDVPYGPDALADFVGEALGALGLRGAPVIANSLGGYLCLKLALRDPGAQSRLVCVHPPGLPTARMRLLRGALDRLPGARSLVKAAVRLDPERWVHKNVHYWDETLKSREEHREYARPLREPAGLQAFVRVLDEALDVRAMVAFERELEARGADLALPIRLVYARRDPMVPPALGERYARLLPRAQLVWLDEASHFAHVDATARFVEAIRDFLPPASSADDAPRRSP